VPHFLNINEKKQFSDKFLVLIIVLMAITLNQSSKMFSFNTSFADLFCSITLIFLIIKNRLLFPFIPTIFFLLVSIVVIFTSAFLAPYIFNYNTDLYRIVSGYIKLIAVFLYFIIGYSLSNLNLSEKIVKWYSVSALLIGAIGVVFTIFRINKLSHVLFYENTMRFRGLINDPNFFSILQVSALSYFINKKGIKLYYKLLILTLITMSVLISGSKTGLVVLGCYIFLKMLKYFVGTRKEIGIIIIQLFSIGIIVLVLIFFYNMIGEIVKYSIYVIPTIERIQPLFTDFARALSEGGSSRNRTWQTAFKIFTYSPIIGIGVGVYSNVAETISGSQSVAHNTYLQLLVEWGLPLTIMFYAYVTFIIKKVTFAYEENIEMNYILRDIIIILLISSLAISLNNARMFWLFLGLLESSIKKHKRVYKFEVSESNDI